MDGGKLYPIYFHLLKRAIEMVAAQSDVLSKPNVVGVREEGDIGSITGNSGNGKLFFPTEVLNQSQIARSSRLGFR